VAAAKKLKGPRPAIKGDAKQLIEEIRQALYASKIVSYTQGYMLMRAAAKEYKWNLNYGGIALMWRGGCIIRSAFLGKIKEAFDREAQLSNLLLAPFFRKAIKDSQRSWRKVVALAARKGIPVPAFSTALGFKLVIFFIICRGIENSHLDGSIVVLIVTCSAHRCPDYHDSLGDNEFHGLALQPT